MAVVLVYAAKRLLDAWGEFGAEPLELDLKPGLLLLSSAIVLAAYAVLIQTWRLMLQSWGDRLEFVSAARIWLVSSLFRYAPGKLWQVGAMAFMSRQAGVSPAAAAGSAVLSTVVNLTTGLAIALAFGWRYLDTVLGGRATAGVAALVVTIAAIAFVPLYLPALARAGGRVLRRDFPPLTVSYGVLATAVVGNVSAWMLYGLAFRLFAAGVVTGTGGSVTAFVVAWAASYVLGYLLIFVPAGLLVREAALVEALTVFGLANAKQAVVISIVSRLWLTVLEILPGLIFLALRPRQRSNDDSSAAPAPTSDSLRR